jgi:hypothetical protein
VYWKPVWYVLEGHAWELRLCNAQHVKNVPGRKTDVSDAAWLAQLLECGLLRGSFVPCGARKLRRAWSCGVSVLVEEAVASGRAQWRDGRRRVAGRGWWAL